MLLQKMHQNGIFPRKKSIVFPVSASPKETWQKGLLIGIASINSNGASTTPDNSIPVQK